jgi:GDP/UDP-N,N'-diacetylbacillosamine 2-epimerase (hydrolysing)
MERFGMTRRKVCYITGTRADYGLMASTLRSIHADPRLSLSILVTGTHLSAKYGETVKEIEADGLRILARVAVSVELSSGAAMAKGIGAMLQGFVDAMAADPPDLVLLLGDRGEMLAGALAAIHLNIPVAHIHGGERSGTVDEPVRHAISKLSHWHCVATEDARERLIRMGELPERIVVTGAPGLDGLRGLAQHDRKNLCNRVKFDANKKLALFIFHPVLQEAILGGQHAKLILDILVRQQVQVLALMPNSDAGSDAVRESISALAKDYKDIRVQTHLRRQEFVSWMAACDLMIGNSSSGIIEAATFGTPVLNVGLRQNLRERNANVVDVGMDADKLSKAVSDLLRKGRFQPGNVYGDGKAALRIVELLASLHLSGDMLLKSNAY